MSSMIFTSAELVVLVAMLGGLVRFRAHHPATIPLFASADPGTAIGA